MKKFLSLALCLALVLSLGVSAFAEITVYETEGTSITYTEHSVEYTGDAERVEVVDSCELTVTGSLTETEDAISVLAIGGSEVEIGGDVTKNGDYYAICADFDSEIEVAGDLTANCGGDVINADNNSKVEIGGNVTQSGSGFVIWASTGSEVKIGGNVTKKGEGQAVVAGNGAKVLVGGDAEATGVYAAVAVSDGTAVVEGKVIGLIYGAKDTAEVYLGELDATKGAIDDSSDLSNIHYLIGFADNSLLGDIGYEDPSNILVNEIDGIEGVNNTYYFFTNTADAAALSGKSVTLKPNDSSKILKVSGFDGAKVNYVPNEDGTVTFTILSGFKGGLQNMVLILSDKPDPDPTPVPVIYVVPANSYTVVELVLPEGVAEGLITQLDSEDHAGISVDSSLVGDGAVKVLKGDQELSEDDFSIYTHTDGSIDVILRSSYLYTLGSGSYDFTVVVNGMEIPFTVVVAI